jgi:hypothetical protein
LPLSEKTQKIQIYSYRFAPERKKPSKYRFTVIGLPLSGKPANTDLQLLVYPLAKKPSKYRFTVIGLPLSGKPANTDLQLLVYPLAEKTSKYRFTVIGLLLREKNQQIQIYSY